MTAAYAAYQTLGWAALGLGWPALLWKALRDPRYRVGWGERLGAWPPLGEPRPLWVHGASVGEVRAAAPLVAALLGRGARLLLTTTSPSGRAEAQGLAGEGGAARLLPLDLAPLVRRAVRAGRPRALVVVETELWPALLRETARAGVPALLVNARISDRTFPRYRRVRRWVGPLLGSFSAIQAQSGPDAERFLELGAPPPLVSVGGNLKFDLARPDPSDPEVAALRRAHAGGWRVVLGGSTHPGEEKALLDAVAVLESRGLKVALVLAPRHLERLGDVEAAVAAAGRPSRRWSDLGRPAEAGILAAFDAGAVLLVDRYGLLGRLYGAADAAFVGGSLVPVGGHNLLEPLNWGVPVAFGPHTENSRDVAAEVRARGLGAEAADAAALAESFARYLLDPARCAELRVGAAAFLDANRGAVGRAVAALAGLGALPAGR
ncbi:MAG: 3-deoxy-D-manno-octulosonic acid transferase [Deltaproteobacteria bacterium]|nr:3-deoxy-D-manno-octulosonic acid transferase [Deltaproteobacteria bacterium]